MMDNSEAIKKLQALNATINNGRGASVIHAAILWLERNDIESAKATLLTDRDKLWQYEDQRVIGQIEDMGLLPARRFK